MIQPSSDRINLGRKQIPIKEDINSIDLVGGSSLSLSNKFHGGEGSEGWNSRVRYYGHNPCS